MKVLLDVRNNLLSRREVILEAAYASNPGFEKAGADIGTHFKTTPELVVVRAVRGTFGSQLFTIEARIYDSVELLTATEPKTKVKGATN